MGAYCATQSAALSLTDGLRGELAGTGVRVSALHVGYMDTDMTAGVEAPKSDPAVVARYALDRVADGVHEILADDVSAAVLAGLSGGVPALYPHLS